MSERTRVVNLRQENCDVFIGRPSPFGNPFTHRPSQAAVVPVESRAEAICAFEAYLKTQPALVARVRAELKGKRLGCWCKPLPCHGDVLARVAEMSDAEVVYWLLVERVGDPPVQRELFGNE